MGERGKGCPPQRDEMEPAVLRRAVEESLEKRNGKKKRGGNAEVGGGLRHKVTLW